MAQNDKGGSDLDVFEGLGKKGGSSHPPAGAHSAPPPPPSARPPSEAVGKRTLLGIPAPTLGGPSPSPPVRTPPPPPGRSTLPPVVTSSKATAPQPTQPRSSSVATTTAGVDVEWDDEDEATQIFDESRDSQGARSAAIAAATAAAAAKPASGAAAGKVTLLGVTAPSFSPLPPPPGFPPPTSSLPPPPVTQPGLGLPRSPVSTIPPRGSFGPPPVFMPAQAGLPGSGTVHEHLESHAGAMESTALLRPQSSRTGLWIVVGLAAAALLAVSVVFLGAPHTGQIVVNVNDAKGAAMSHVDIFVDGRKQCDSAPCLVDQVANGSHEVKVVAEGFNQPAIQNVSVEGRKQAAASFTLSAPKGSGLKASGTQPGVKLYVDGKEIGPLPQEVYELSPGDHIVKVAGSERYESIEKHVTIDRDQIVDLGNLTLKVLHGKATITLATPGARVSIVSGTDRRELPMLPISVDIDTTKAWSLEASRPGYEDYHQPISFDDGQAEKSIAIALVAKTQSAPPVVYYGPATPAAAPAALPPPAPAPAPVSAPAPQPQAAAAPAPAAEAGEAFLNINSIPPSTCFVDGRSLGSTPRIHVAVKAGTHTVRFINADQGLTKTISVSVNAGETKPAVAKLN
jgi:hypothetical protein